MDVQQILKQLNINPQQAMKAWSMAQQMGAGVKTKEQAMRVLAEKGIDKAKLQQIGTYINSPMADMIGSMAGVNVTKIRQDFNSLLEDKPATTITPINSDAMSKYKNGLKQL
jgi:hypothetical protein